MKESWSHIYDLSFKIGFVLLFYVAASILLAFMLSGLMQSTLKSYAARRTEQRAAAPIVFASNTIYRELSGMVVEAQSVQFRWQAS